MRAGLGGGGGEEEMGPRKTEEEEERWRVGAGGLGNTPTIAIAISTLSDAIEKFGLFKDKNVCSNSKCRIGDR